MRKAAEWVGDEPLLHDTHKAAVCDWILRKAFTESNGGDCESSQASPLMTPHIGLSVSASASGRAGLFPIDNACVRTQECAAVYPATQDWLHAKERDYLCERVEMFMRETHP
jgi:hypothetical protein